MPERTDRSLILAVALLTACAGRSSRASGPVVVTAAPDAPPAAAVQVNPVRCPYGCTLVVAIESFGITPVVAGPFAVTSINPGGSLALAVTADPTCADVGPGWFEYSGGGVRIGTGQTLCVRSRLGFVSRHAFSGYRPDVSIP